MLVQFDEFQIVSDRRELSHNGKPLSISPKAFQLLMILIDAAPKLVSREEIYRQLWPDVVVEDGNLHNLIAEIRSALGESAKTPKYIRTLHRLGYRFCGLPEKRGEPTCCALDWGSKTFQLAEGQNLVGRDTSAQVRIDRAGVSRRHAVITIGSDRATIEDRASKNGTFVNGERIERCSALHHLDTIRVGPSSLTFRNQPIEESTLTVTLAGHDGPR
jgi:DNA-binding winged helix-turn-helix (wHTH) protein